MQTQLRTIDPSALAQISRALVGFDRYFNGLPSNLNGNYPPYNIVKYEDNKYGIEVAAAGFNKDEITVEVDKDQLMIKGKKSNTTERDVRSFSNRWGKHFQDIQIYCLAAFETSYGSNGNFLVRNKLERFALSIALDNPFKGLNSLLYGFRPAELITVTAGSGLGKSQFLREILYHILNTTKWNIGGMFLEESVRKTARSIMSLRANKLLHLPDTKVSTEELKDAFDHTLGTDRIYLFDHFGSTSADNIINRIRYMVKACDCRIVFLDHLSIIISGQDNGDERKAIDVMMARLRTLVQELNITLIVVSHLKRPSGNQGHEDGQAVSLSQLRGSGAIAQLSEE